MDILSTGTLVERYIEIVSSVIDLGLTSESPSVVNVTGSSPQNIILPDATTCFLGTTFTFTNNSTGTLTIYLSNTPDTVIEASEELVVGADEVLVIAVSGNFAFATVVAGATLEVRLTDTSTIPGGWVSLTNTSATVDLQSVYDASGVSPAVILNSSGLVFTGTGPIDVFNSYGVNVVSSTYGLNVQYSGALVSVATLTSNTTTEPLLYISSLNNTNSPAHILMEGMTTGSVGLKAPDNVTSPYVITFPTTPGSNGYTLVSDALSNLSWVPSAASPVAGEWIAVSGSTISVKRHATYLNSSGGVVNAGSIVFLKDNGGGVLEIVALAVATSALAPDSVVGIVKNTIAIGDPGDVIVVHGFEETTSSTFTGMAGKDAYISPTTSGTVQTDLTGFAIGDHVISIGKCTGDTGKVIFAPRYVMTY